MIIAIQPLIEQFEIEDEEGLLDKEKIKALSTDELVSILETLVTNLSEYV